MLVGIISDTHLNDPTEDLHPRIYEVFQGVDLILHAGDIYATWVLDRLERIAPVRGARAYDDPEDPRLERRQVIDLHGTRVAITHNIGMPETAVNSDVGLVFPAQPSARAIYGKYFGVPEDAIDVIVHGDTHEEHILTHEDILFVNPGSPTYPGIQHAPGSLGTVALMTLNEGPPTARILQL